MRMERIGAKREENVDLDTYKNEFLRIETFFLIVNVR